MECKYSAVNGAIGSNSDSESSIQHQDAKKRMRMTRLD